MKQAQLLVLIVRDSVIWKILLGTANKQIFAYVAKGAGQIFRGMSLLTHEASKNSILSP
jgi:hypothetical protein